MSRGQKANLAFGATYEELFFFLWKQSIVRVFFPMPFKLLRAIDILPRLKSWDSGIRTTLASVK